MNGAYNPPPLPFFSSFPPSLHSLIFFYTFDLEERKTVDKIGMSPVRFKYDDFLGRLLIIWMPYFLTNKNAYDF